MSANNFWNSLKNGFTFGMLANTPMFSCFNNFSGFGSWFGGMSVFGGFNNCCFNNFFDNTSLFMVPNTFTSSFYQVMPNATPPSMNFNFDASKMFDNSHIWDNVQNTNWQMPAINNNSFNMNFSDFNWGDVFSKTTSNASLTTESTSRYSQTPSSASNKKLTDKFQGSAEQLNKQLNRKNGVLKNKGEVFLAAQEKYGINAAILAAIAINESAYGTSKKARNLNNVGGIRSGAKGFKKFNSVDECIMEMARLLKNSYINKGLTTIAQVGAKYCPPSDPEDKNGLNSSWPKLVSSITKQIENMA